MLSSESNCPGALSELEIAASSPLRDWQPVIAAHGHVAGVCGQPSRAVEDLRRFDDIARNRFVTSYGYALIYAGLREKSRRFSGCERRSRSGHTGWCGSGSIRVSTPFALTRAFSTLVTNVFPGS